MRWRAAVDAVGKALRALDDFQLLARIPVKVPTVLARE